MNKKQLMELVYTKDELQRIDTAIPAAYWDGKKPDIQKDPSIHVMNYNEPNTMGILENLLSVAFAREINIGQRLVRCNECMHVMFEEDINVDYSEDSNGVEQCSKCGGTEALMDQFISSARQENLVAALDNFKTAYEKLSEAWSNYSETSNDVVGQIYYPFELSFDEIDIKTWVSVFKEEIS